MIKPSEFEHLVDAFKSLPGVGSKNAKKWAYYIINQDKKYVSNFANRLIDAKDKIKLCIECGNISSDDICSICSNPNRDRTKICVVATSEDLDRFESSNLFDGLYHVTHGELSIRKNVLVQHTNLDSLLKRVQKQNIQEVVIATNYTHDGEMTAEYIYNLLKPTKVSVFRIGFGLPMNSNVDYADDETLKHALNNKRKIKF